MNNPLNPILIVDDEKSALNSMEFTFRSSDYNNIVCIDKSDLVLRYLKEHQVDVIFLDITMPVLSGNELLRRIKDTYPNIPVIMITGLNDVNMAVECMKIGAEDYLLKPIERSKLLSSLSRVLELRDLKRQYSELKEHMLKDKLQNPDAFQHIVTSNKKMLSIFKYMEAIGKSNEPVLIMGETGTGKELFARAIYNLGNYKGEYVSVNVAGLDDTMFSDTLFGHVGGAYTGATSSRSGLVEKAKQGVLFLDEIGDLSIQSQVKILRLIQEKEYYPLGIDVIRKANCRIVVATNVNLNKKIEEEKFRRDLFYRLSVHTIQIPPLKERRNDIPILTNHFIEEAAESMGKKCPTPVQEFYKLLKMYSFPGNVRELRALIYDAVSQHESKVMSLKTISKSIRESIKENAENNVEDISDNIFHNIDDLPTIKELERQLIDEVLERSGGNQSMAARMLGITRQTLKNKING